MSTERTPQSSDRRQALILIAALAALMWVVEIIDQIAGGDLDQYGIEPRETDGLIGVATAPFLHAGFDHLIGNTVPFLILGATIALSGLFQVAAATLIIIVVGGLGTWLVAPAGTDHIGASGVVFGYATFLIARGVFTRSLLHLAVGLVVIAVFGTTLLSGLVPTDGISWQGHLFGGIGGVIAAALLDRPNRQAKDPISELGP
jgi:membrane associated rhomboid family serine protease